MSQLLDTPRNNDAQADAYVLHAVQEHDVPANGNIQHYELGSPSQVWRYHNRSGGVIALVCRFETQNADGNLEKDYRPYTFGAKSKGLPSWNFKAPPEPRPLYRLHEIIGRDAPLLVCEGEKSADAAAKLFPNFIATTPMNGAQSPSKTDWMPVRGRHVVVAGDNDDAGRKFTKSVARLAIEAGAVSVQIMKVEKLCHSPSSSLADGLGHDCPPKFDLADARALGWNWEHIRAEFGEEIPALLDDYVLPEWPFRLGTYGVEQRVEIKKKDQPHPTVVWERICSPLQILGRARSHNSDDWSHVLRVQDPDGAWHEELVRTADLNGPAYQKVLSNLASVGLVLANRGVQEPLWAYITKAPGNRRVRIVTRSGWQSDGSFVTPGWIVSKEDTLAFFDGAKELTATFSQSGSLASWKKSVAEPCAGNPILMFSLCVAFAAIVAPSQGLKGFGVHVFGSSSTGKSTALHLAASVWGEPERTVRSWNMTATAIEASCAVHSDMLLCLDELSQSEPDDAWAAAYMIANGQGKGRGTVTGGIRDSASWNLVFLSNGEVSFGQHVSRGRRQTAMAGQKARVISIPADEQAGLGIFATLPDGTGSAAEFSDALKHAAMANHGTAAEEFVRRLFECRAEITERIAALTGDFMSSVERNVDGQILRVARNLALVAAAGELAIQLEVLPFERGAAKSASLHVFDKWLADRGNPTKSDEIIQGVLEMKQLIANHGESRFTAMRKSGASWQLQDEHEPVALSSVTRDRLGFRYQNQSEEWVYLFLAASWGDELFGGRSATLIASHLKDNGVLKGDDQGKNSIPRKLPGFGVVRVYELNGSKLMNLE